MKVQNPHDKFFKETFGDVLIVKDFFNNYLPEIITKNIDLNTLEPQKDSFINAELKEEFSDLLFKTSLYGKKGYIYFLFEHKSYPSKSVVLQLLKYMINIWETKTKKEDYNELPIIIPLVIYHGRQKWNIKNSLGEMIKGYDEIPDTIKEYIPDFKYCLYDLSQYTDDDIKGQVQLRILLITFRDIFKKDGKDFLNTIFKLAEYLSKLDDRQRGIEYFETYMQYIYSARAYMTQEEAEEIVEKIGAIYPEGSEVVMTLAERLRKEGKEEGIKEGIKEGKLKKAKENARAGILKGYSTKVIIDITGLTEEQIEEIKGEIAQE